ncbi:hypothetical protein BHE74_00010531 [Ensete ventricosum]|nr:hypothetical protein GW17_00000452 [Ensete ventricosum]RWW81103.1 hypothetical protein BHE74_00010531 [Ensete ventricosum]
MFEEEGTARTKLLSHLGFSAPDESADITYDDLGKQLENTLRRDNNLLVEGEAIDNGEEFFNNPQIVEDSLATEDSSVPNGKEVQGEPMGTHDASFDDTIQRALVVGDYKGAVLQCTAANRMADALVIAHAGGPSLWESTRDQYLRNSLTPYLKCHLFQVVSAMVNNDLMNLINTRPLNSWKETLALLCTFAQKEEWTVLCDNLASRLVCVGNMLAATLCYICAGNIDRTVEIWSHSLKPDCEGRTYVDLLQDLMEKTIVLTLATGHKRFSASLSKLVENYAELLANQGLLTTAMEYLKLLGSEESSHELAILRDRISLSAEGKRLLVSGPLATGRFGQKPTVASARAPSLLAGCQRPCAVAARGSRVLFLPRGEKDRRDGVANSVYQPGPPIPASHGVGASQPAAGTGHRFSQPAGLVSAPRGFMPVPNSNFTQMPGMSPAQPSSPTKPPQPQSVTVPSAPPTVQTVDTSNVPGNTFL